MIHMTRPFSYIEITIFPPKISKLCYMKKYRYSLHFDTSFLILLTFWAFKGKGCLNIVTILMISANKDYGVIISVHEVNNRISSRDSNYIIGVVMWPKFSHSIISKRDVIITSFLLGLLDQTVFFQRFWFKFNNLGLALNMALKTYPSVEKD